MAYKKFIKRDGKVFGPYYYESYRGKDGSVKKKYVGTIDPDGEKKQDSGRGFFIFKKFLLFFSLIIFLALFFSIANHEDKEFSYDKSISSFSFSGLTRGFVGMAVQDIGIDEDVVESFDSTVVDLEIKDPPKNSGIILSKNKNKRMDFDLGGSELRLYFDLLNYSEFVDEVAKKVVLDNGSKEYEEGVSDDFNFSENNNTNEENLSLAVNDSLTEDVLGMTGNIVRSFVVNNVSDDNLTDNNINSVLIGDIRDKVGNLDKEEINEVKKKSVVEAEDFNIDVEASEDGDYKWGYDVRLNSLDFLAKVEITSENEIFIWNNNTLRVGNNLLSFADLEAEGYTVRVEVPALIIDEPEFEEVFFNESLNNTTLDNETVLNETILENVTNFVNETFFNETIGGSDNETSDRGPGDIANESVNESLDFIDEQNETLENEINDSLDFDLNGSLNYDQNESVNDSLINDDVLDDVVNETIDEGKNSTEDESEESLDFVCENVCENICSEPICEESCEEVESCEDVCEIDDEGEEFCNVVCETEPVCEEVCSEPICEESCEEVCSEQSVSLTGNMIKSLFSITGMAIGFDDYVLDVEDVEHEYSVTVYIEKDFSGTDYSVGDIITLDPTLIVIELDDAEHLDENRGFISNIYDEVKAKDGNWSEVIGEGEYVRVTFEEELNSGKDITIYARGVNGSAELEVYEVNDSKVIGRFDNINEEGEQKIYLTNLSNDSNYTQDVFDLKVLCGVNNSECGVEFDLIIDPSGDTNYWICNSEDDFNNSACWSLGSVPVANETVIFNGSGIGNVNIWNNTMPQNLSSFTVDSNYSGDIYFHERFAVGSMNVSLNDGTQEWNVTGDIIINGTSSSAMFIYGDTVFDYDNGGRGQEWRSLEGSIFVGSDTQLYGVRLGFASGDGPGAGNYGDRESSHGGKGYGGSSLNPVSPLNPYGNATGPVSLGSGTSGESSAAGGSAIKLNAFENTVVEGVINMRGGTHSYKSGAGGSIWLIGKNITGGGYLYAESGDDDYDSGGGRIRLGYTEWMNFTGYIGLWGYRPGTLTFTNNTWPTDWIVSGTPSLQGGDYGEGNVTQILGDFILPAGSTLYVYGDCHEGSSYNSVYCWGGGSTYADGGLGVWINASGDINISGTISGNGLGFGVDEGPGQAAADGDGGSHGGLGGSNSNQPYGNYKKPRSIGSGGQSQTGGSGIKLEAVGFVDITGSIGVAGLTHNLYDGGAGGSVWISGQNISGDGTIYAYGGGNRGGGAGGRVAITANNINGFNGTVNVKGDVDGINDGGGGTIYMNSSNFIISNASLNTYGYVGGNITIEDNILSLFGIYNATGTSSDGSLELNYSDCSSSFLGNFNPYPVRLDGCVECGHNITILYPSNDTPHYSDSMILNITISEEEGYNEVCLYSINDSINQTMTRINDTFYNAQVMQLGHGFHNLTVSCNDSFGTWSTETEINFNVNLLDLAPEDIILNYPVYSENETFIDINVSNTSPPPALDINVSCYVDGVYVDSNIIADIPVYESRMTNCTYNFTSGDNYNLTVIVDPENEIAELNETNNYMMTWVNVTQTSDIELYDLENDSEDKFAWFSEEQNVLPTNQAYFFVNYTMDNSSLIIEDATCNISFEGGVEDGAEYSMNYNSSYGIYYYNRSFNYAGNYSWSVNCSKDKFESLIQSSDIGIRVLINNDSSFGYSTFMNTVNYNENVNITAIIPQGYIDISNFGYNVSSVWIVISMPNGTVANYSLTGDNERVVWNYSFDTGENLGDYNVTYYSNLTNGNAYFSPVYSNFSVQNTTILIVSQSETNTTEEINVNGLIRRTNGVDYWPVDDNLFTIKLNNVTVSSDTLNHSNFTGANGTDVILSSHAVLNLTEGGDGVSYNDDYSTTAYQIESHNYTFSNIGFDASRGSIFSWNHLVSPVGNITYKFDAVTEFYNAIAYVVTGGSESGGGANTSIWYSYNNSDWNFVDSSVLSGATIGGIIPVDSQDVFYVLIQSDTNGLTAENPVTSIEINYTNYNYSDIGNLISPGIYLPDITYTVLRWDENLPSGTDIKMQLRESDDGAVWDSWSLNYTSGLDNDITSFSKDYIQYRAWLSAINRSMTPILQGVQVLYFNATTNSTGGYDYNITIPTDSLGVLPLEVSVLENSNTGIIGTNQTDITIWAETNVTYDVVNNYTGTYANYTVNVNYSRLDTGALINGTIDVNISNATNSWMQSCSGVNMCSVSWIVPTDLINGNYTINISGYNESAYYRNVSFDYDDYLEERNTTGTIDVLNKTIGDFTVGSDYIFYWNVTVNNTGNAGMNGLYVYDFEFARSSGVKNISELTPCSGKIYPGQVCNVTMIITMDANANVGIGNPHFISWRANWTDNDGGVAGGSGFISDTDMYVTILGNSTLGISNQTINKTIQHDRSDNFTFQANSIGSTDVSGVTVSFVEGNLTTDTGNISSSWVSLYPESIALISAGGSSDIDVNISVPAQTAPGNYTGMINLSSLNGGELYLNLAVEVPLNTSWYFSPTVNDTYNLSFSLDTAGQFANYTIYNTGNVNLTMDISYSNTGTVDYTGFGTSLFEENQVVGNTTMNPTSVNVTKGSNTLLTLYQKGNGASLMDVGVVVDISNSSGVPSSGSVEDRFNIEEAAPEITDVFFYLDDTAGEIAELNKNLTIKFRATDDLNLNTSGATINVTWGGGSVLLNATGLSTDPAEYVKDGINFIVLNYTANYTVGTAGEYNVFATVLDASGRSGSSYVYNFTSHGTTGVGLSSNVSALNVSSIDRTNQYIFYVNYSINNTGNVTAYSPELNFSGSQNISFSNYTFSNLNSSDFDSYVSQINISELTLPGEYNVTATLRWRNPDNTYSTDSEVLTVNVFSNKSLDVSPVSLNATVPSGASNSSLLVVNNTGNDNLVNITFDCYSGSLCTSLSVGYNESGFNISSGSSKVVNISFTAVAGLTGGNYTGSINMTEQNISRVINATVFVPETLTWSVSPDTINSTRAISSSGNLSEVEIENTGNVNITFDLVSNDSSIIGTNVSSLVVPKGDNRSFMVNYSAPALELSSIVILTVSNSSADPVQDNVTINLTSTDVTISVLSPSNSSKLTGVSPGDNITLTVNATYGGVIITNESTWEVSLGGSSASDVISTFDSNNSYWNISCVVPNLSDGGTYDLTATINHITYGVVSGTGVNAVTYLDITAPNFTITRNNLDSGSNINLSALIVDNVGVNSSWFDLAYPNSTTYNNSLSFSGGNYIFTGLVLDYPGEYLVNYSANDSTGNENSTVDWFEVYDRYYWVVNLTDYNSNVVSDVNMSFYRPSTLTLLVSNVSNDSGIASLHLNKRFYDMDVNVSGDNVIVRNGNFTNLTGNNISFNAYKMSGEELVEIIPLHKPFVGIATNSSGFDDNSVDAVFNYSGYSYDASIDLTIVQCSNWNYTDRSCVGSWVALSALRNLDNRTVSVNSTGLGAYFLAEDKCGNGACETSYLETISTCSADCQTSSTTVVSGGGGGGGGGLSSSDLKEIENIVKSFLDVGGINLETTSIYKELFAGDSTTVRIKLKNTVASASTISMRATGEITQFIFFDSSTVELGPNEIRDVLVKIIAPKFVDFGDYNGDIVVTSGEEEGSIPVNIKILAPEGKLLDVKVQPLTQSIAPGEVLRLQTDLLNLGKTERVDVQFDLQLLDVETGEVFARTEEAFAVETSISTVKNITIPETVPTGRYMIKAIAYYSNVELDGDMQASSIAYVDVQYNFFVRKLFGVPMWAYFVILLVVILGVGAYYYYKWLEFQKKRFKSKIELNKLPLASSHSGFVGMVAETGIRAFVDMNKLQMHTLIAGSTGSGKTVAAQGIIEEALTKKKSVIVFDPTAQWTGYLRKCEDDKMLKRYKYFGMKSKDARSYDGTIQTIHDPYELIDIKKYMNRPGEITIFNVSHLTPKQIDTVVASTIEQIFKSEPDESADLKTLIVYDEVHRLLPKFGGTGQGFVQIERGAREFRKWGIGLFLISQVLSDFVGEIKANIGTEVQMGTRYEGDLERVNMKYGEDVLKSVVKEPIGTGMVVNAEYNAGRPYFVSFRPILHSTKRLSKDELVKYEKYFNEIEDLEYQVLQFKNAKIDVMDFELEIKLAKGKIKSGQFQMADMYLETLRPKVEDQWKKLGKKPVHLVRTKLSSSEVLAGIKKAKIDRAKYIKKNPDDKVSFDQKMLDIKKRIEEEKKKGKDTSSLEIKMTTIIDRLKPFKGKVSAKDSPQLDAEIKSLEGEVSLLEKKEGASISEKEEVKK